VRERGKIVQTNRRERRARLWLIVGREEEGGEPRPLAVDVPGGVGRALAVFSFEEEARMYLRLGAPKGRWRVQETRPEELASLLLSETRPGVRRVALDPMGEILAREANRLLSTSRESFLSRLLAPGPEGAAGSTGRG